jgi:Na+/glutamate symporter
MKNSKAVGKSPLSNEDWGWFTEKASLREEYNNNALPDVVSLGLLLGLALVGVVIAMGVVWMVAKLIMTLPFYVHVLFVGILV